MGMEESESKEQRSGDIIEIKKATKENNKEL